MITRRAFLGGSMLAAGVLATGGIPRLTPAAEAVVLQYWHQWGTGPESKALADVMDVFMALHPNIRVVLRNITETDQSPVIAAIKGGYAPDLVHFVLSTAMPQFAFQGWIRDLTTTLNQDVPDWADRLYPLGVEACQYDGRVYGLANANFNVGLLWNADIFSEVGLDPETGPLTTEALLADADKMYKTDASGAIQRLGFLPQYPGVDNGQFAQLVLYGWARGGEWYDASTKKITANDPKNVAALQWELDVVSKYGIDRVAAFLKLLGDGYLTNPDKDLFQSGRLGMIYDGPWNLDYAPAGLRAKIRTGAFPSPENYPDGFGTSFFDVDLSAIPIDAPHPAEAWLLLKFLAFDDAETCSNFAQKVYNMCSLRVHPPFDLESDARFERFVNQQLLPSQRLWPRLPISDSYLRAVAEAERSVLAGEMKPQEALDKVTHDMQASLDQALSHPPVFVIPPATPDPAGGRTL